MAARSEQIATGLQGSVTLGAGQFCTNPGLVFLPAGAETDAFVLRVSELLGATPEQTMLTPGIRSSYQQGVGSRLSQAGVATVMQKSAEANCGAAPALFKVDAAGYLVNASLSEEIFGPTTLIVTYGDGHAVVGTGAFTRRSIDGNSSRD